MEPLKAELEAKGGNEDDWNAILSESIPYSALEPHVEDSGEDPMKRASAVMGVGKLMEYDCVDSRWRPQGKAVVELVEFAMGIISTTVKKNLELNVASITFAKERIEPAPYDWAAVTIGNWFTYPAGAWSIQEC